MNAVCGQNLSDVFAARMETTRAPKMTPRRTRRCHGQCAFTPDDRDTRLGRERPRWGHARGEVGGSKVGVAHAPLVSLVGCDSGAGRGSRRHRAPPASGAKPQPGKDMEPRTPCIRAITPCASRANCTSGAGNGAPEFRFPHPVPRSRSQTGATREGGGGRVTVRPMGATADRAVDGEAAL
jgi:hypothetical protein